jgi:hypothetical protein
MSLYHQGIKSSARQSEIGATDSEWGFKHILAILAGFFVGVITGRLL